jgi:hypothetical protein
VFSLKYKIRNNTNNWTWYLKKLVRQRVLEPTVVMVCRWRLTGSGESNLLSAVAEGTSKIETMTVTMMASQYVEVPESSSDN